MIANKAPIPLSDWYELVEDSQLRQGDIIENCPTFLPPTKIVFPINTDNEELKLELYYQDVIIMTQSCDLEENPKADIRLVILCPIWKLSEAAKNNPFLASSFGKEECRRGHMTGYHMIKDCIHERWNREISVVSFRDIYSLPLSFIKEFVSLTTHRPRIKSPYREHLAQAFARYFMRVGLPVDIPKFESNKKELEATKIMRQLDQKSRERVIAALNE